MGPRLPPHHDSHHHSGCSSSQGSRLLFPSLVFVSSLVPWAAYSSEIWGGSWGYTHGAMQGWGAYKWLEALQHITEGKDVSIHSAWWSIAEGKGEKEHVTDKHSKGDRRGMNLHSWSKGPTAQLEGKLEWCTGQGAHGLCWCGPHDVAPSCIKVGQP